MTREMITMNEARETINHLVQGVDPYTGEVLEQSDYLHDPRMIRCFAVMSDVLTRCIEGNNATFSKEAFKLTEEKVNNIKFPDGEHGVMKIIGAINEQIDHHKMKRLSAFAFNKKLIEEGLLSYSSEEGSKKAVINDKSEKQGIISVKSTFNNEEYDKVVYTEKGKAFVLKNLSKWFV